MLSKVKNDQRFAGLPRIVRNSDLFLQSWRSISAGNQETLPLLPLALIRTGPRQRSIGKAGRGRSGSERALRFVDDRGKTYREEALCWQNRGLGKPPGDWLLLREPRLFRSPCVPTSLSQPHTWAMGKDIVCGPFLPATSEPRPPLGPLLASVPVLWTPSLLCALFVLWSFRNVTQNWLELITRLFIIRHLIGLIRADTGT